MQNFKYFVELKKVYITFERALQNHNIDQHKEFFIKPFLLRFRHKFALANNQNVFQKVTRKREP